jgi:hypothetical protein
MYGDRPGDSCDRGVTAHNPQQVTEMTGMTTHFKLYPRKEKEIGSGRQLAWIERDKGQNLPSSPSLLSLDRESTCHNAVTKPSSLSCPICGVEIGPGNSSRTYEGVNYCTSCPPSLSLVRQSVKALAKKNGAPPATSEIYEDVASKGIRPPKREHMSAMLRAAGCVENEGKWSASQDSIMSGDDGRIFSLKTIWPCLRQSDVFKRKKETCPKL